MTVFLPNSKIYSITCRSQGFKLKYENNAIIYNTQSTERDNKIRNVVQNYKCLTSNQNWIPSGTFIV